MVWRSETFARLNEPLDRVLGDRTAKAFTALRVHTVSDLVRHLPRRYFRGTEDTSDLSTLRPGEEAAVVARVRSIKKAGAPGRERLEVVVTDGRHDLPITFFAPKPWMAPYWEKELRKGVVGIFIGKVGTFRDAPQLTHPNFVMLDAHGTVVGKADRATIASAVSRSGLVGIYPATSALPTWTVSASAAIVLEHLAGLPDPLPEWVRSSRGLVGLEEAIGFVHAPVDLEQPEHGAHRLRFDEALALQVTMVRRRRDQARHRALAMTGGGHQLLRALDDRLPFALTAGQEAVSRELFADLAREQPMQRLLQGEVGSGKTLVALRAMLRVLDSGHQAALLAPTEVLATQHAQTIRALLGDLGGGRVLGSPEGATSVVLLTGSLSAGTRRQVLADIASGEAGIVVGTHALLGDQVRFASLGLVVVDEQHRFGVEQRARLSDQAAPDGGPRPHVLVMTATPIPRTVAMTAFGDLETSTLTEVPAGRAPVQTTVVDLERHPSWLERAWGRIREEVAQGHQAIVVAPTISASTREDTDDDLIETGDSAPPTTVEDLHRQLVEGPLRDLRVALMHGRLPAEERSTVMAGLVSGEVDVVVSTTVVEVGVDLPRATVMVVMDADRFGISQLHQLRGRIGRGTLPGLCLLVTRAAEGTPARDRLAAVAATRDGFVLAEADLEARREGNVLGSSQAGTRSTLRLLRVLEHADLIADAREVAERLVEADPDGSDPHLADMVTQTERAAGDWWEKS